MSNGKKMLVLAQIRRANKLRDLAMVYSCEHTFAAWKQVIRVINRVLATN